ncbi:MAG: phosphoglycolate phosphatase [Methyloprofundus sp.]|nr:phosphoglycolate phosphatase [Methyloprofundus sp.]
MIHFKPELIVFDLDGTLVDSSPDIASAVNKMLVVINQRPLPEQLIKQWLGNGATMLIKRALTGELEPTTEPENLAQAMTIYFDFYASHICVQSKLYTGVIEGLEQLKAAGVKLACVTNKPAQLTLPLLTEIGLKDYFQFIACGDTFTRMKPDPLPLLEAAKACAVQAQQALMVGDSISDIQAGKRANFKTALVPYGYIGKYTLDELDADYNIDKIDQLSNLFY